MFLIRDSSGKVYNTVKNPAVVLDGKVLLKIGEYEDMVEYFHHAVNCYIESNLSSMIDDMCVVKLPHIQEEIDKVFQISGYIPKELLVEIEKIQKGI